MQELLACGNRAQEVCAKILRRNYAQGKVARTRVVCRNYAQAQELRARKMSRNCALYSLAGIVRRTCTQELHAGIARKGFMQDCAQDLCARIGRYAQNMCTRAVHKNCAQEMYSGNVRTDFVQESCAGKVAEKVHENCAQ